MIPINAIVRIAEFSAPSDIRWRVTRYIAESDRYELTAVASGKSHEVERVLFHAWLRRKQLIREKPTV